MSEEEKPQPLKWLGRAVPRRKHTPTMSPAAPSTIPRLAILPDYPQELWPSMELVADMLARHLAIDAPPQLHAELIRAPWKHLAWRNLDRLMNRLVTYPRYVRANVSGRFDCYHVCDHSYSQLVHVLPAEITGVFCHDLDTFRCVLEPTRDPRPRWFRKMAGHILRGMQRAAIVFYASGAVRDDIMRHQLIDPSRLVHAPLAPAPEFTAHPENERPGGLPAWIGSRPFVLHVGSCIPRKRVDVLLDVFARLSARDRELVLVQVGGEWTAAQRQQSDRLGARERVIQLRGLPRAQVAALYRQARVVLLPSESEGFGLPAIEALACGAALIASDLPALREVAGGAAIFCPVGDVDAWTHRAERALNGDAPTRELRLKQAAMFSWRRHASIIREAYLRLLGMATAPAPASLEKAGVDA
jgi:glycosyltransferase involved in cell wall biosynthesis